MSVTPTTSNTHISDNFGKLLEPGLRKIFFETYAEVPEQYSRIFNIQSSSKAKETDHNMGAMGDWTLRTSEVDTVQYDKMHDGKEIVYTHSAYTKGFMIGRELYDDEQYRQIQKFPKAMARGGRAFVEKQASAILVNAFTTNRFWSQEQNSTTHVWDWKSAVDTPLCSDTHFLIEKSQDGTTYGDNKLTTELSDSGLKEALQLARKMKDEAGNLITMNPKILVVPPALEFKAKELLNSTHTINSDVNNVNTLKDSLSLFVYDYLGDQTVTSGATTLDTNKFWFLIDPALNELNFFWRVKPEFKWDEDFDTFVAKYRGYMRFSFGASDWRGIIGSTGTTAGTDTPAKVEIVNSTTSPVRITGGVTVDNPTTAPVNTKEVTDTTDED